MRGVAYGTETRWMLMKLHRQSRSFFHVGPGDEDSATGAVSLVGSLPARGASGARAPLATATGGYYRVELRAGVSPEMAVVLLGSCLFSGSPLWAFLLPEPQTALLINSARQSDNGSRRACSSVG